MKKKVRNGIYTTGQKSFRVSDGDDDKVIQIDAIDDIPVMDLKTGQIAKINKDQFESFLNEELRHYFWHKD